MWRRVAKLVAKLIARRGGRRCAHSSVERRAVRGSQQQPHVPRCTTVEELRGGVDEAGPPETPPEGAAAEPAAETPKEEAPAEA